MANAQNTTANLTAEMQTFYDKVFLERLEMEQKYNFLAGKKVVPKNSGKVVYFTRQTVFTPKTTALTEGTNPTGTPFSSENISAQVAEYGDFTEISSLFSLTTIDSGLKEKVETMGQYAGESMDTVLRNVIDAGATEQLAGAAALLTAVAATDTMSVVELRKAVLKLRTNKAPRFPEGVYRAVVCSQGIYELQGDSALGNFTSINVSTDKSLTDQIKKGEIKRIAGVDMLESNNQKTEASTVTVYSSYVAGKGAIAEVDVAGSGSSKIIHNGPTTGGTANPLQMFGTLGWKVEAYAAKVLNSDWVIKIRHA